MPAFYQVLQISIGVFLAFTWLQFPSLAKYTPQAVAIAAIIYTAIKRKKKNKIWHLLPLDASEEMALATFSFLLLVGSTGNLGSIFYPLTIIHLFFLVMSSDVKASIVVTFEILIFHFAMAQEVSMTELTHLLSIPLITTFFLFTKKQYEEVEEDREIINSEEKQLDEYRQQIEEKNEQILKLKSEMSKLSNQQTH